MVVGSGQTFAPAADPELPRSELAQQGILEFGAEPGSGQATPPAVSAAATLKAVAANELRMFVHDIPKTGHVDSVRSVAERFPVFHPGDNAVSTRTERMIHQVAPNLSAGVRKSVGELRRAGVQQDSGAFQGRSAQEYNLASELQRPMGHGVDRPDPGGAISSGVVQEVGDGGVGL